MEMYNPFHRSYRTPDKEAKVISEERAACAVECGSKHLYQHLSLYNVLK